MKFSEQLKLGTKFKDSQEGTYTWPDARNPRGGIGLSDFLGGLTPGQGPEIQGKVWIEYVLINLARNLGSVLGRL